MEMLKEMDKKRKILALVLIVLICLIGGTLVYYFHGISAVSHDDKEIVVSIPKGSSGNDIIEILDKNGLIQSPLCAKIYLKMNSFHFQSNCYILNKNMDLSKMLSIIEGQDKEYISNTKITVVDGHTIVDYAKTIEKSTGIAYHDIIAKWADQNYLKTLIQEYWFLTDDILQDGIYYPLEGYLAPETYFLTQETTNIESITKMMLDQTEKHLEKYKKQLQSFQIGQKTLTIHEMMTLSSIVQRESPSNSEDRRLIAGILINRLNKPMRLQSDVTVNYGNQVTKVDVNYQDLNKDTLYNTYRHDGLPVGPISSVSTHVIQDVLNYKTSDYYYFFATKEQKVLYAKTFEKHQENVSKNKWY